MTHTLHSRWGDTTSDCTAEDMARALAELDADDPEHPDAWLSNHDLGLSVLAGASGWVVLEDIEGDDPPRHVPTVPRAEVQRLWTALRDGDLDTVLASPWQPGYPT